MNIKLNVRQLRKYLKNFDGDLPVMTTGHDYIGTKFFPVQMPDTLLLTDDLKRQSDSMDGKEALILW